MPEVLLRKNAVYRGAITHLSVFGCGGQLSAEIQVRLDKGDTLIVGADCGELAFSAMAACLAMAWSVQREIEIATEERAGVSPRVIRVDLT